MTNRIDQTFARLKERGEGARTGKTFHLDPHFSLSYSTGVRPRATRTRWTREAFTESVRPGR